MTFWLLRRLPLELENIMIFAVIGLSGTLEICRDVINETCLYKDVAQRKEKQKIAWCMCTLSLKEINKVTGEDFLCKRFPTSGAPVCVCCVIILKQYKNLYSFSMKFIQLCFLWILLDFILARLNSGSEYYRHFYYVHMPRSFQIISSTCFTFYSSSIPQIYFRSPRTTSLDVSKMNL